jgi:hypothetical protein
MDIRHSPLCRLYVGAFHPIDLRSPAERLDAKLERAMRRSRFHAADRYSAKNVAHLAEHNQASESADALPSLACAPINSDRHNSKSDCVAHRCGSNL